MNIAAESYGQAVVLILKGEFNADTLEAFNVAVEHQLTDATVRDIVLNLEGVPFIDSAALESTLTLQQRLLERMGQVKLLKADANVRKILEITRLDACFECFEDSDKAVKTL